MKLEVGGYYVLRNGEKVGPLKNDGHHKYPFDNGVLSWTKEGHMYHFEGSGHPLDIVSIDPMWKLVSDAVDSLETGCFGETDIHLGESTVAVDDRHICHLALKHPSKASKLMDTDDGFRLAAHQLADKLAHALLEDGQAWRRHKQKVKLWLAACKIILDSGADVVFGEDLLIRMG